VNRLAAVSRCCSCSLTAGSVRASYFAAVSCCCSCSLATESVRKSLLAAVSCSCSHCLVTKFCLARLHASRSLCCFSDLLCGSRRERRWALASQLHLKSTLLAVFWQLILGNHWLRQVGITRIVYLLFI